MENPVLAVVKASIRLPVALLSEARKVVDSVLDRFNGAPDHAKLEAFRAELKEGVRADVLDAIETVKVGDKIREKAVTADDVPI